MVLPLFGAQALMIGLDYVQGIKNAKAQFKYQKELQDSSVNNAAVFASNSYAALQDRAVQINDAIALNEDQAKRAARKAASTEKVSSAESGSFGISAQDVQQEFSANLSEFIGVQDKNLQNQQSQLSRQMDAVGIQQKNAIQLGDPVQSPSAFGAATNIFSAYLQTKAAFPQADTSLPGAFDSSKFDFSSVKSSYFK